MTTFHLLHLPMRSPLLSVFPLCSRLASRAKVGSFLQRGFPLDASWQGAQRPCEFSWKEHSVTLVKAATPFAWIEKVPDSEPLTQLLISGGLDGHPSLSEYFAPLEAEEAPADVIPVFPNPVQKRVEAPQELGSIELEAKNLLTKHPLGKTLQSKRTWSEALAFLYNIYPASLVDRLVYNKDGKSLSPFFTRICKDFSAISLLQILVSLRQHLTIDDAQIFWNAIRDDAFRESNLLWRKFGGQDWDFSQERVTDFTADEWARFLTLFEVPEIVDFLEKSKHLSGMSAYASYARAFEKTHQEEGKIPEMVPIAYAELWAKLAAYVKPESAYEGAIFPSADAATGKKTYYRLDQQIHYKGVHIYFFQPLNGQGPVKIGCRGTQGSRSMERDFDISGIGKQTFQKCQELFLRALGDAQHVEIMGHSLGGADTKLMTALFVSQANLKSINMFAFCAPKTDDASVELYKQAVANSSTEVNLYYAHHKHDIVPMLGSQDLPKAPNGKIVRLVLGIDEERKASKLVAYHTEPFFQKGKIPENLSFVYYDQTDTPERLRERHAQIEKSLITHTDEWWQTLSQDQALWNSAMRSSKKWEHIERCHQEKIQLGIQNCWMHWLAAFPLQMGIYLMMKVLNESREVFTSTVTKVQSAFMDQAPLLV
ncbi:MAG: hypothetical protein AAGF04_04105 [Chlamydiota bacterium]